MATIKAGNLSKGMYILYKEQPHYVLKTQFVSPGKGSAFTKVKLRDMRSGSNLEFNFKSHDSIEELEVETKEMQYLYHDADEVVFMDPRSYEQLNVPRKILDEQVLMLTTEIKVYLNVLDEKVIGVILPPKVKMAVAEAQDAVAGDRQNAGKKPVTMETGLIVQAPLFIKTGDVLLIDTETSEYVSRVNE